MISFHFYIRLAEAMWLKFKPMVKDFHKWQFDVLGTFINPLDVVVNGSQHLHAIQVKSS